jgi:dTDP-4-dehydrorhamnose reductase
MRLLITGAEGQLGRELDRTLSDQHEVITLPRAKCDVTNLSTVLSAIKEVRPAIVLHPAAMTAVDACEREFERAYQVNAIGSRNVAIASREIGAWLVAYSTDFVFSGESTRPYHEFDRPDPINVYGASKLAGEQFIREQCPNHLIIRTAWLYGDGPRNFVGTILKLAAEEGEPLPVVDDQVGSPTSTRALARQTSRILDAVPAGTFHAVCHGEVSRYVFAQEIVRLAKLSRPLRRCESSEFPSPARRPTYSALDNMVLRMEGHDAMPDWIDALRERFG